MDSECVQRYEFKGAISADMVLYASWTWMDEGSKVIDPSQYNSASNTLVISTAGTGDVFDSVYLGGGNRVYFVAPETGTYKMYYRNEKEGQNYTSAGELFNVTQNTRVDYIALTETTFYYESSYGYRYDYCLEFTCNKGDVMRLSVSVGTWYSVNTYFYFVGFTSNSNTSTAYADVDDYSKPTFTSQGTIEEKVTFGESFELLIPVREGYTFDGWYYNGKKVENGEWNIDEDVVLTAKWVAN